MDITIDAKNANELDSFIPVEGQWFIGGDHNENTVEDVIETVINWMDADYKIDVQVFHLDGRHITGDLPSEGTFLATRKS